jgi:hypothetical protein
LDFTFAQKLNQMQEDGVVDIDSTDLQDVDVVLGKDIVNSLIVSRIRPTNSFNWIHIGE